MNADQGSSTPDALSGGSEEQRPALVYPVLVAGLLCFASSAILVRFAREEAPGLTIAAWRTFFAVLMLTPVAALNLRPSTWKFTGRDALMVVGAGLLLGLHFVLWIESLYLTSVASATVLVSTSPVFLALLSYVLLRERLARTDLLGVFLATAGAALIGWGDAVGGGKEGSLLGNVLALIAALVFSFYLIIGRVVRRRASWLGYSFPLYAVVAAMVAAFAFVRDVPMLGFGTEFYVLCGLMAIGPQILGHGSFNYAIRYFPAAFLGLLSLLEPVGATIMAYFFFDETPGWTARMGILLVLLSVAFVILKDRRVDSRSPPPLPATD